MSAAVSLGQVPMMPVQVNWADRSAAGSSASALSITLRQMVFICCALIASASSASTY